MEYGVSLLEELEYEMMPPKVFLKRQAQAALFT